MTNKLICPVCGVGEVLEFPDGTFACDSEYCKSYEETDTTTYDLLIQSQKDLEIARKALKETQHWLGVVRCSAVSHLNNQNNTLLEHYETDPTVQNIDKAKSILKQYLEQIEHKEQI